MPRNSASYVLFVMPPNYTCSVLVMPRNYNSIAGVALPVIKSDERAREILEMLHHGKFMEVGTLPHQGTEDWSDVSGLEHDEELKEAYHHGTHLGRDKTMKYANTRWRFPTTMCLKSTIMNILERCESCQRTRGKTLSKTGAVMHPIARPDRPCARWGIDLIGKITPMVDGFCYIITCVDSMTKYLVAGTLKDKTAVTVCLYIYNNIICRFGVPGEISTDQGSEFNNFLFKHLTEIVGVKHIKTSPYNPAANGLAEVTNKTIQSQLRRLCGNDRSQWVNLLQTVVFNYNSAVHSSTQVSPYKMMHGFEPVTPIECIIEAQECGQLPHNVNPCNHGVIAEITKKIFAEAKKNNIKATEKQCKQFGKRHGAPEDSKHLYPVGSRVWKWNAKDAARKAKNVDKWFGPYRVVKHTAHHGYILTRDGHKRTKCVPQNQLIPYLDADKKVIVPSNRYPGKRLLSCLGLDCIQVIDGKLHSRGRLVEEMDDITKPVYFSENELIKAEGQEALDPLHGIVGDLRKPDKDEEEQEEDGLSQSQPSQKSLEWSMTIEVDELEDTIIITPPEDSAKPAVNPAEPALPALPTSPLVVGVEDDIQPLDLKGEEGFMELSLDKDITRCDLNEPTLAEATTASPPLPPPPSPFKTSTPTKVSEMPSPPLPPPPSPIKSSQGPILVDDSKEMSQFFTPRATRKRKFEEANYVTVRQRGKKKKIEFTPVASTPAKVQNNNGEETVLLTVSQLPKQRMRKGQMQAALERVGLAQEAVMKKLDEAEEADAKKPKGEELKTPKKSLLRRPETPRSGNKVRFADRPDDAVSIVEEKSSASFFPLFYPISYATMLNISRKLNVVVGRKFIVHDVGARCGVNPCTIDVAGDGNCLFRALSFCVSGKEQYYDRLRAQICRFMKNNEKKMEPFIPTKYIDSADYVYHSKMEDDGVWGTDIEIWAAAMLFEQGIYVYSSKGYLYFSPTGRFVEPHKRPRGAIFIRNHNNLHYTVMKSAYGHGSTSGPSPSPPPIRPRVQSKLSRSASQKKVKAQLLFQHYNKE